MRLDRSRAIHAELESIKSDEAEDRKWSAVSVIDLVHVVDMEVPGYTVAKPRSVPHLSDDGLNCTDDLIKDVPKISKVGLLNQFSDAGPKLVFEADCDVEGEEVSEERSTGGEVVAGFKLIPVIGVLRGGDEVLCEILSNCWIIPNLVIFVDNCSLTWSPNDSVCRHNSAVIAKREESQSPRIDFLRLHYQCESLVDVLPIAGVNFLSEGEKEVSAVFGPVLVVKIKSSLVGQKPRIIRKAVSSTSKTPLQEIMDVEHLPLRGTPFLVQIAMVYGPILQLYKVFHE